MADVVSARSVEHEDGLWREAGVVGGVRDRVNDDIIIEDLSDFDSCDELRMDIFSVGALLDQTDFFHLASGIIFPLFSVLVFFYSVFRKRVHQEVLLILNATKLYFNLSSALPFFGFNFPAKCFLINRDWICMMCSLARQCDLPQVCFSRWIHVFTVYAKSLLSNFATLFFVCRNSHRSV